MAEVLKLIRRTPYQSLTILIVLFFLSFITSSLIFTSLFFSGLLKNLESIPQVIIYFKPETKQENIAALKEEITQRFQIKEIKYISQKQAYNIYKRLFKNQTELAELVTPDMLPPSLEIRTQNPEDLYKIAEFAKTKVGVDEVDFQKDIVDKLLNWTKLLQKITFILSGIIFFISLIILISVISFKISLQKKVIETTKLLGATNLFILKPFLNEMIFLTLISSSFSFFSLLGILTYLEAFITQFFTQGEKIILSLYKISFQIWPLSFPFLSTLFLLSFIFTSICSILATFISSQKYVK